MHVGSGNAEKVWHLPEKLLKSTSTFFTAALEGGFAEAISGNITLPEEDPDIFEYFVEWLYVGYDQEPAFEPDFSVSLWTLGDRLGCPLMQDDAMCDLLQYYSMYYIEEVTLKQIYKGSAPGSKIRQFAVDQCLFDLNQNDNESSYLQFVNDSEDFAQQLAAAIVLLGSGDRINPCHDESQYLCAAKSCASKPTPGS